MHKNRRLYKPAYVYYHGHPTYIERDSSANAFFNELQDSSYPRLIEMTHYLVAELKKCINKKIGVMDIILETTPVREREVAKLEGFQFYDSKLGRYERIGSEVTNLNDYLKKNRRSYIFCVPQYYNEIKEQSKTGKLNNIFGKVIEKMRNKK